MNFTGYVPLNRGLIEHTVDGRMTNNEALVFVWLLMLANRKTGGYTINGPTLRAFLPGLSKGAAQRALESLERKHYIYRDITPRSPIAYPYFINGFRITDGANKMRQLDLSEVFASKDISKLRYVKDVPDTEPAMQLDSEPVMHPDGAKNNEKKKGEEIHKREKETYLGFKDGERKRCMDGERRDASQSDSNGDRAVSERFAEGSMGGSIGRVATILGMTPLTAASLGWDKVIDQLSHRDGSNLVEAALRRYTSVDGDLRRPNAFRDTYEFHKDRLKEVA